MLNPEGSEISATEDSLLEALFCAHPNDVKIILPTIIRMTMYDERIKTISGRQCYSDKNIVPKKVQKGFYNIK